MCVAERDGDRILCLLRKKLEDRMEADELVTASLGASFINIEVARDW